MSDETVGTVWSDDDGLHVDARGLMPPDPMVAILRQLVKPGQDGPVIAYLDRDPIYLYPELAEMGWSVEKRPARPGETCLILRKSAP